MLSSVNPATGETLARFEPHDAREVERRLACAAAAAVGWRRTSVADRARVVAEAGALLEAERRAFARMITAEMGKPLAAALEEVGKCAAACRWYADHAERFLAEERVPIDGEDARVIFQPLGVVLAVMPWNFPFWQVVRFAAPALTAGNVGLLKHASNVPQCAVALESLFARAGAPEGVFQTLLVGSDAVAGLLADPRIHAATLTGSERAGSSVAEHAGRHIKKTVLELGGSDAFVVMPSANLDDAVAAAVRSRTLNNGQSCISAKRFIVHEAIADDFTERFVARMRALVVGDPTREYTNVGPLATKQIRDDLHKQVLESVRRGARLLLGGKPLDGVGWYYPPTVLVDAPADSPALREELFGPVAVIVRGRDIDDVIRIANDSRYGLGAAAWTTDDGEAGRFARELEAGTVVVNGIVASDPRLPFGGIKLSGYGRELSVYGMREFQNVKTIRMHAAAPRRPAAE